VPIESTRCCNTPSFSVAIITTFLTSALLQLLRVEEPWTLELDDALASSFIAPATDRFEDDKQLTSLEYERTWDQNEELGLNDMDTAAADVAYAD
jgi:zinc finger protein